VLETIGKKSYHIEGDSKYGGKVLNSLYAPHGKERVGKRIKSRGRGSSGSVKNSHDLEE